MLLLLKMLKILMKLVDLRYVTRITEIKDSSRYRDGG